MITIIQGRPGQGKTVWLVSQIEKYLQRGYNVYGNIEIKFASNSRLSSRYHFIEPENILLELPKLREGKVFLDEVQVYLNARKWDSLPDETQVFLQQHRKRGLDIIGACQSIKRADVVFRELVQVFYTIEKIMSFTLFKKTFGWFLLREYDPDYVDEHKKSWEQIGWPWFNIFDPYTFKLYDTTQEYNLKQRLGSIEIHEYRIEKKESEVKVLINKKTNYPITTKATGLVGR